MTDAPARPPAETVAALIEAVGRAETDDFVALMKVAALDPGRDLRFCDWSGVDFSGCDLRRFDFTGANLMGCRFQGARIVGARFEAAQVENTALRAAADWAEYVRSWQTPQPPPGDRHLPDLAPFVDAPWCPEMVVIPAGTFLMGSPLGEKDRSDAEGPQHTVTIGYRFALGRYAVTVGQYRKFVEVTGHRHEGGMYVWTGSEWKQDPGKSWQDPGFAQADRHPVVGVNWHDAVAYCEWLAKATGKPYRLPSEAEWEYAARAGTTTRYAWGDAITPKNANYFESKLGKTSEVGAYPPNPWGLYDVHGNVWEWVEDVWHENYKGAPVDGSAWTEVEGKDSSRNRVVRGGSWDDGPGDCRSAFRIWYQPDYRSNYLGFRVARTLS